MILAALALEVWTLLFFGFFGSELLGTYPVLRVAAQLLFVAPLAIWALLRLRGPRATLDWAILGALAAMLVVSLASADPQGSLESVGLSAAYATAFFALRSIGAGPRLRTPMAVAVSFAFSFWLIMISIWWIQEKVTWIQAVGTVPNLESKQVFIWGTANAFPIFTLLAIGFLAWLPAGPGRRVLAVILVVTGLIVIPLSVGRAAWLGFLAAAVTYEVAAGWPRVRAVLRWLRLRRLMPVAGGLAGIGLVGGLALIILKGQAIIESNLSDRLRIWSEALGIFSADPLTGGGPSTFSWLRLTHVPDYTYAVPVRLTHDVPVQTLADGGLILFVAFGTVVVLFVRAAWSHRFEPRRRVSLAVLVGFGAASLLDDFSSLPAIMVAVLALAAWTLADGGKEPDPPPSGVRETGWRFTTPALLALAGLIALPAVIGVDAARTAAADARAAAVDGNWTAARSGFDRAIASHAGDAAYWLGLGLARWHLGDTHGAGVAYERAGELSPGDPRAWGALAALTTNADDRIRWLVRASRLTITDPQYALRLGDAYAAAGRDAEARGAYGLAVGTDPTLIGLFPRHGVSADAAAGEARSRAAALHGGDARIVDWDLSLALGELPSTAGPAWRAVDAARSGDLESAQALANEALQLEPYYGYGLPAVRAVATYACDTQKLDQLEGVTAQITASRPGSLAIVREHTYREDSLGDYQPLAASPLPPPAAWPWSLVPEPAPCPEPSS